MLGLFAAVRCIASSPTHRLHPEPAFTQVYCLHRSFESRPGFAPSPKLGRLLGMWTGTRGLAIAAEHPHGSDL